MTKGPSSDSSERKRALDAADKAHRYATAIVATIRQPLLVLSPDLRVQTVNEMFYEMFEVTSENTLGKLIFELDNGQWDIPELRKLLEDTLPESEEIKNYVVDHTCERRGRHTFLLNAHRLKRVDDCPELILLAIEDTTAQTNADAHRDLLIDELCHRVKNTLATIQTLASRTLRQANTMEDFKMAFEGRLLALARAHDLLVEEDWKGTSLNNIARRMLEPYVEGEANYITIGGPEVHLSPQAGTALVMILHELATNAAKYGALSAEGGNLALSWRLENDKENASVRLEWIETCAHEITPPTRTGFGSHLIESSVSYELRGSAKLDFRDTGLHCDITFPLQLNADVDQLQGRTGV